MICSYTKNHLCLFSFSFFSSSVCVCVCFLGRVLLKKCCVPALLYTAQFAEGSQRLIVLAESLKWPIPVHHRSTALFFRKVSIYHGCCLQGIKYIQARLHLVEKKDHKGCSLSAICYSKKAAKWDRRMMFLDITKMAIIRLGIHRNSRAGNVLL
eukprot:c22091_g1_i2 orf=68-529(+)